MTIQGTLQFPQVAPASVVTPPATYYSFFVSDGTSSTVAGNYYKKDSSGTVTPLIPVAYTNEDAQDAVGSILVDSASIDFTYDDSGNTITAIVITEAIQDIVGALISAADGTITVTYNDAGNTLTIGVGTITSAKVSDFTEAAQDAVGAALTDTATIDMTYNDGANTITADVIAASISNAKLATMTTRTVKANITAGTATPTDVGEAAFVTELRTNGGLVTGLNGWIDVTQHLTNPVLPANSSATNVTNLNAILSAAATGSTIYFPGGTYGFNATITVPAKVFTFQGQGSNLAGGYTLLSWTSNVGANLMALTASNWYTQFRNLIFTCSVSQTAGAALAIGDNVSCNVVDCSFVGLSSTQTLFNCLDYTGNGSGENTVITNVTMGSFTGTGININGVVTSPVLTAVVMQGQWGTATQCATAGITIQNAGAVVIDDCDIIGCVNNLLINPTTAIVVASVYVTNTYFDNSLGSCIKITGAGATVRCRFIACSFTTASAGAASYSAVEISTTVTAGAQGIDFENCSVLNTFATGGTTNGFNLTGAADFSIIACRVAGWTNGIQVTPFNSNGKTQPMIEDNTIGPTGGFAGNVNGIVLNAGSFQYGAIMIQNNQLIGNTTSPLTDNSTIAIATQKVISGNGGLVPAGANVLRTTPALSTTDTLLAQLPIPAASPQIGQAFRYKVVGTLTVSAATISIRLHYGTVGTAAGDATISTHAPVFAAVGGIVAEGVLVIRALGAAAAQAVTMWNTTTGLVPTATNSTQATAAPTIATTTANFLTLSASTSAGSLAINTATLEAIN